MALKPKKTADVRPTVPVEAVQQEELVRVNLNVPESMRTRWKFEALARRQSLGDLIVEAVEAHIKK